MAEVVMVVTVVTSAGTRTVKIMITIVAMVTTRIPARHHSVHQYYKRITSQISQVKKEEEVDKEGAIDVPSCSVESTVPSGACLFARREGDARLSLTLGSCCRHALLIGQAVSVVTAGGIRKG
ncbi:hypothetical protein E2C01_093163 [Portunus trituberculatus]|uniref:Uncharacterized protein n=1 Tax=Portunus trituberculatus TaxID=210409 RepID=A0A5B7JXW6_PORTR|nr:hypothetical protein [Portunus trituberculatus]